MNGVKEESEGNFYFYFYFYSWKDFFYYRYMMVDLIVCMYLSMLFQYF